MKRHPTVESVCKSLLLEEDNFLRKEAEKARHLKGSRREAERNLRALPPHSLGNKFCFSVPPVPEPCLCGCSLRTKAVLHPRPPPVSRPASRVLPSLSTAKKQLSAPVVIFRAQLSQSSPKPKAKAKSQPILGRVKNFLQCHATPQDGTHEHVAPGTS